jgi:hypothetical protein
MDFLMYYRVTAATITATTPMTVPLIVATSKSRPFSPDVVVMLEGADVMIDVFEGSDNVGSVLECWLGVVTVSDAVGSGGVSLEGSGVATELLESTHLPY